MSKVSSFISTFLFRSSKCYGVSLNHLQKCAYEPFCKSSPIVSCFNELITAIHTILGKSKRCIAFENKKSVNFPSSGIVSFTLLEFKISFSTLGCFLMSRKKRRIEVDKTSNDSKIIKRKKSHKKNIQTKNDWYLVCKKKHKKSKKKKRKEAAKMSHLSDSCLQHVEICSASEQIYNEGPSEELGIEDHKLLEEAFDSCCKVDKVDSLKKKKPVSSIRETVASILSKKLEKVPQSETETSTLKENTNECQPTGSNCSDKLVKNKNFEESIGVRENNQMETDVKQGFSSRAKAVYDKLEELRSSEWVFEGQGLVWEPWDLKEVKFRFKVISYNVLSQELLVSNPHLYRYHSPAHLNWTHRAGLLLNELKNLDADIICLQEVEAQHKTFYDDLSKYGYKGIFKKRTGDKNDGCAIYYKTSNFTLIDYATVEFQQEGIPVLNRDNIGIVAKFHPVGWDHKPLVVATTHLLYNPRRHDVKLAQMQVLLAEIERFAYNSKFSNFTYHPVILTGDFNLEPYTSVYKLLMSGSLRYDILDKKMLEMDGPSPLLGKQLLPSDLGITDTCQHLEIMKVRDEGFGKSMKVQQRLIGIQNSDRDYPAKVIKIRDEDKDRFESGVLSHGFDFESVYYHEDDTTKEPEATTHHDKWLTVDYMLYTPLECSKYHHHQLQLVNRKRLPTVSQCEKFIKRIPNEVCPSDHLPLVATFYLRVRPPTEPVEKVSSSRKRGRTEQKLLNDEDDSI